MSRAPRCRCGRLRPAERPTCCNQCENGAHNVACCMRQVSLAEGAGQPVDPGFAHFVQA
jgi:hypothetical protein